jgi:hypothetical protein
MSSRKTQETGLVEETAPEETPTPAPEETAPEETAPEEATTPAPETTSPAAPSSSSRSSRRGPRPITVREAQLRNGAV